MKKLSLLQYAWVLTVLTTFFAACSSDNEDDKTPDLATAIAGTYNGYSTGVFKYGTTITPDETFTITRVSNTTAAFSFTNETWGEFSLAEITITEKNNVYTISGSGSVDRSMGTNSGTYDYTLSGTIKGKDDVIITISLPTMMMGGTVITFVSGEAPANQMIAGKYEGYSSAVFMYSPQPIVTAEESLTFQAETDKETASLTFTSKAWGSLTATGIQIESKDGNKTYTVAGEGKAVIEKGEQTYTYDFTLTGNITSKEEASFKFVIPSLMQGGTTIDFITGEAPATPAE